MFAWMDDVRRPQGAALEALGFGPAECAYRVLASGPHWRLREYAGSDDGPPLLIVAAPIKRPYIWDLAPSASAVRYCLSRRLRVYLLEWTPATSGDGSAGLDEYADRALGAAVARVSRAAGGTKPFLMGHSLGGTLAAVFAALDPGSVRGLVLLGTPLCFAPGTSRFRDGLVALAPSVPPGMDVIPGSLVSLLAALASPKAFVWSRLMGAARSAGDPRAAVLQLRIERWALDEVLLPGKLVDEILGWLFREDRFCKGTLPIRRTAVGPSRLRLPVLAVVNTDDEVAPPASVRPFLAAMPKGDARVIEHAGEAGVGLQHLAILLGRESYARVWPEIVSWLNVRT